MEQKTEFINRDISWLAFNRRVLAEAESNSLPLLERARFLAIVSSNLDEFFMVRMALLRRAIEENGKPLYCDGLTPRQTLAQASEAVRRLVHRQYEILRGDILPALRRERLEIVTGEDLSASDLAQIRQTFANNILPALTPLAVDPSHPFPLLAGGAIYLFFRVRPRNAHAKRFLGRTEIAVVQVPPGMERFIRLPAIDGNLRLALLEDAIRLGAADLLRGYEILAACPFRVTRDADFTVDDEQADSLLEAIEEELRSRRRGQPVRLEIVADAPDDIVDYLRQALDLDENSVYRMPGFLDLKCLYSFISLADRPDLCHPPWPPQPHHRLQTSDIWAAIREGDILLSLPYHSFNPVAEMAAQAAADPAVLSIKITLYRVSGDSPVVRALLRAAEAGKQVTALVELRARFDEERNIQWARQLDAAGAHVIYGIVGYKCHAKALLVIRREEGGIRRYVYLSTGNFNDRTARLYTDLGLFTCRPDFGADISAFFNVITGYSLPPVWHHMEMAPTGLRRRFLAMIEREIAKHTPESPGFIRAKMNSLTDPEIIEALYRASAAGVRIDLLVRGMCCLRVGIPGKSENIMVKSVIDRLLEHSRIYHFRNGGDEEVYLASADWMERNLDSRVELLFPLLDAETRAQALAVLNAGLADTAKSWYLQPDGTYGRRPAKKAQRSQQILYQQACADAAAQRRRQRSAIFQVHTSPPGKNNHDAKTQTRGAGGQ